MIATLKRTYWILGTLLLSCFIISLSVHSSPLWLKNFSLDVAAEITGILLALFSIDRVMEAEKQKKQQKLEQVALKNLRRLLLRHFQFVLNLFHIAPDGEDEVNRAINALFIKANRRPVSSLQNNEIKNSLDRIDLNRLDYLSWECQEFRTALSQTVEKYSLVLQPDMILSIEKIINSPLIWLMLRLKRLLQNPNESLNLNQLVLGKVVSEDSSEAPRIGDFIGRHILELSQLIDLYNENCPPEERIENHKILWSDSDHQFNSEERMVSIKN